VREIVADKRCENGHFIDESWDLCPYCPADKAEQEIPIVRPSRFPESRPASAAAPAPASAAVRAPVIAPTPPPPEARVVNVPTPPVPRREPGAPLPPMERTVAVQKLDASQQPKRYVVGWLIGLNGSTRGESYAVRMGRNVLGRDRRSDIVVNDDQASSHHADLVFRPEEKRFILMDHNSTNGTYVNELEIEPRRDLVLKDIIRIGSHRFVFMPLCQDGFYWDDDGVLK
jgi:hypothetical protein